MTLYNYRSDGTVTKWDTFGNIESQYLVSEEGCTCPAGHRPTCRHRQMLPHLLPIVDTHWFLIWGPEPTVVDFNGMLKSNLDALEAMSPAPATSEGLHIASYTELPVDANVAEEFAKLLRPATQPAWRRL